MPRKKRNDDQDRRLWHRVHLPGEVVDVMANLLASRRLPMSEAHVLIDAALRAAYPDEYAEALARLAKFNHVDEPPE